jgi:hypothetical protein
MGKSATDEARLSRFGSLGLQNESGAAAEVYCPLNRRNTAAYRQPPNRDQFLLEKLTIYLNSNSRYGVVSCRVFAHSAFADKVYESAPRYACDAIGGCPAPPAARSYGYGTIEFDYPFGYDVKSRESIYNIGYRCTLPRGGYSSILGSEGQFRSEAVTP